VERETAAARAPLMTMDGYLLCRSRPSAAPPSVPLRSRGCGLQRPWRRLDSKRCEYRPGRLGEQRCLRGKTEHRGAEDRRRPR